MGISEGFQYRRPRADCSAVSVKLVTTSANCCTCDREAGAGHLPPRECVAADGYWRVAHAFNSALPGWLVLVPRRRITSVSGLTEAAARALGTGPVRLSRALHQVPGCQQTYVARFAGEEGSAHVHVHVVARPPDLAGELRGPRIFQMPGAAGRPQIGEQKMDEIARELAAQLGQPTGG